MKNINEALENLVEAMKADYIEWTTRCDLVRGNETLSDISREMIEAKEYEVVEGRNYYKIISHDRSQQMVAGFVCKKANEKKGFKVGDLLKAAGWSAPATNFARGNIFDLETAKKQEAIRWTGIQ